MTEQPNILAQTTTAAEIANRVVRIDSKPANALQQMQDLWSYRDLLYFLIWREVKVRYKQTVFGAGWAILQPFMAMVVFTVFFGRLAKMPSDGLPYPLFAYAALTPWQLFANGLTQSANSLVNNQGLIKKVYFPRLIVPLASVLEGLVDFSIAFVVLVVMCLAYGVVPTANVLWLPLLVLLSVTTAFSVGLWLSALNAQFRDIRYTVGFLTQIWMFATPIAYSASIVPTQYQTLYGLNPMVGVINGFRWALLGAGTGPGPTLTVSCAVVAVLLVGGLAYFRRVERTLADVL